MSAPKLIPQQEIARLVHDLKTPLAAMHTAAELISNDPLTHTQQHHLTTLKDEICNLQELATIILHAQTATPSEQDAPISHSHERPARSVHEQLRHIVDLYAPQAKHAGLNFVHRWSTDAMSAYATNANALQRILGVLIDNAIQHTNAGTITLSAHIKYTDHQPHVVVDLKDSGSGLTTEQAGLLNAPSPSSSENGNGIGLWSTRCLARELGGDMRLIKNSEYGACFEILLPLHETTKSQSTSASQADQNRNLRTPLKGSVLVVDDNKANRHLLEAVFSSFGLDVKEAANGMEALRIQKETPADLIFLDLNMPEMNGSETLKQMMQNGDKKPKAYFAITASVPPEQRPQLLQDGFTQILEKPVNPPALYSILESALRP
ncbi:hybrid sensor histidine kinase/response regulator [Pseudovibrio sp. Tun.PSC04-5.I4]|uniref:ATP-binding response regulator n=1 Tax=Pseudovibrio sp. Tun.PSC04-5.I4 TaxID=1798213 RepID=UPI00088D90EE|nr:hybrid sensor histidine kinase/response regulator [Pseudovibrio sp. Tun.PSC04-5.I4]SDR27642.1 Histidine kinase-, DNA gyrase B-, and HSP90-like ATPase [Pseudovibrio sp. Tun.PSC04-5.I4]